MPFPPSLKAVLHRVYNLPRWAVKPPLAEMETEAEEKLL
jgi:hypothetical protein